MEITVQVTQLEQPAWNLPDKSWKSNILSGRLSQEDMHAMCGTYLQVRANNTQYPCQS